MHKVLEVEIDLGRHTDVMEVHGIQLALVHAEERKQMLQRITVQIYDLMNMQIVGNHAVDVIVVIFDLRDDIAGAVALCVVIKIGHAASLLEMVGGRSVKGQIALLIECSIYGNDLVGILCFVQRDKIGITRQKIKRGHRHVGDHGIGNTFISELAVEGE